MWQSIWNTLYDIFTLVRWTDILDIIIVAYVIYKLLIFIRETRALQLVKGIGILLVVFQISVWVNLNAVNFLLRNALQVGILAILIVFQPEFRRALEQVGRSSVGRWFGNDEQGSRATQIQTIDEIIRAAEHMSSSSTGALIVIEKETKIGDIISTGVLLGADVTAELLVNIFVPNTPLHDGAVVIRGNKIEAAACFLPLSQNSRLSKELGTRHRAGIGMSENSDAIVVIVSEETGRISVAQDGDLKTDLNVEKLTEILTESIDKQRGGRLRRNLLQRFDRGGDDK